MKYFIRDKWHQRWVNCRHKQGCKLYEIMLDINPFYMKNFSRKDEGVIHRIRIGHTRLTYKYLMEDHF